MEVPLATIALEVWTLQLTVCSPAPLCLLIFWTQTGKILTISCPLCRWPQWIITIQCQWWGQGQVRGCTTIHYSNLGIWGLHHQMCHLKIRSLGRHIQFTAVMVLLLHHIWRIWSQLLLQMGGKSSPFFQLEMIKRRVIVLHFSHLFRFASWWKICHWSFNLVLDFNCLFLFMAFLAILMQ